MSHYTETSDTAARADSARDARHNGGDWPTGGYHWRCNDQLPRRQHWTYRRHGGLVSLLNWNRAIRRERNERAQLWAAIDARRFA